MTPDSARAQIVLDRNAPSAAGADRDGLIHGGYRADNSRPLGQNLRSYQSRIIAFS